MKQIDSSAVSTLNDILTGALNADNISTVKDALIKGIYLLDREVTAVRTTSFQTGPDEERDCVCTETLLMKLALAESVIADMARYIEVSEEGHGTVSEDVTAPSDWAISGVSQNLMEIAHALRCGCWGHQEAFKH